MNTRNQQNSTGYELGFEDSGEVEVAPSIETVQDPLSIVRVAADLYPDITGGGAIHANSMSRRQAAVGHDVTVITSDHGNRERPTVEERNGYTIIRNRQIGRPFGNSITPGVVPSILKRVSDADIVHAHSHLYFTSNVTAAIARFCDAPLVLTNHGLISQTAPTWLQKLFIPTIARFTFNSADRILCYTETDEHRLRDRGVSTPIEVVKNGVNCRRFVPGSESDEPRILFVGRLTDAKGVPTLLETFARLSSSYPELQLRIVGDGPKREAYERQSKRLGVADRVTFAGDTAYEYIPKEYQESSIFVLPSYNEGLPRTVLEAMACETPVVTSNLPQLESIVDGAGFTVEAGATEEFVDAIKQLVENPELREECGQNGRQRVLQDNVWSHTVQETTQIMYELVNETS